MSKQNIKYANCWEDAYLLEDFLKVDNNSVVMSISSAGDNSLYLLKSNPKRMICVDYNPVQLYITELKACAIKYLSKSECLAFLGFDEAEDRNHFLSKINYGLSNEAAEFWSQNVHLIKKGIIHQGKFERYLRIFSQRLLPLVRAPKMVDQLLVNKSKEEQLDFYNSKWTSWQWRLLFKSFFNKTTMGRLGRDPEKFAEVKGEIEQLLWQRTEKHFKSTLCQENYMLDYILTGKYGQLPPYLEYYDQSKKWLQQNNIEYHLGDLIEALHKYPGCNRFNLSNIFEYMNEEDFKKNINELLTHSGSESILCFWNLLVKRVIENEKSFEMIDTLNEQDRGFFYNQFYCYKRESSNSSL